VEVLPVILDAAWARWLEAAGIAYTIRRTSYKLPKCAIPRNNAHSNGICARYAKPTPKKQTSCFS
jgi:hypothetical protein